MLATGLPGSAASTCVGRAHTPGAGSPAAPGGTQPGRFWPTPVELDAAARDVAHARTKLPALRVVRPRSACLQQSVAILGKGGAGAELPAFAGAAGFPKVGCLHGLPFDDVGGGAVHLIRNEGTAEARTVVVQ